MRAVCTPIVAFGMSLWLVGASAADTHLLKLSPARDPAIGEGHGLAVAVIFPSESTAQLVVLAQQAKEVRSQQFEFAAAANYGAVWGKEIEIKSSSSVPTRRV